MPLRSVSLAICLIVVVLFLSLSFPGESPFKRRGSTLRKKTDEHSNQKGTTSSHSLNTNDDDDNTNTSQNDFDWKSHVRFFVLGVQKGGTTSLYKYLGEHPQIQHSHKKETRCFHVDYQPNDPYCARYFANPRFVTSSSSQQESYITGDFSPGYLSRPKVVAPRIQQTYPHSRFLVSLRHPLERAVSQYRMNQRNSKKEIPSQQNSFSYPTFDELCRDEVEAMRQMGLLDFWDFPEITGSLLSRDDLNVTMDEWMQIYEHATVNEIKFETWFGSMAMEEAWARLVSAPRTRSRGMIEKGLYAIQLHYWLQDYSFDRDQFFVFALEETSQNLSAVVRRIHAHLGIPHVPLDDASPLNTAPAETPAVSDRMYRILKKLYQPFDDILPSVLGPTQNWTHVPWVL